MKFKGVYDIETESWDRFVLGAAFDGETYVEFRSARALLDYMLERGGVWGAHNGGRFDTLCMLNELADDEPAQLNMAGSRIISAKMGKCTLRDTFALAPLALADLAPMVGKKKGEPGFACVCDSKCGGYCAIRRDMSEAMYGTLGQYLEQDCRILFDVMETWIAFMAENFGGQCKGTIGATSWAYSGGPICELNAAEHSFCRKGYFGGRTEAFKPWSERGFHYDINSAYIHALTLPMPAGKLRWATGKVPSSAKMYIAEAIIDVPDCHIPPLPLRTKTRLFYPTGRIEGVYTSLELESLNVHKLGRIAYWEQTEKPYEDYCRRGWAVRTRVGKNTVLGNLTKRLLVSEAGKLAQNPEVETVVRCSRDKVMWGYFPIGNSTMFYSKTDFRISECSNVHHAAFMTAHTRRTLERHLNRAPETAVYCDTDSHFNEKEVNHDIGPELGQFERQEDYARMRIRAPKFYKYETPTKSKEKTKGFPRGSFDMLDRGLAIRDIRGVMSLKMALRGRSEFHDNRVFKRISTVKQLKALDGWIGGRIRTGDGGTRSPTMDEVKRKVGNCNVR